MARCHSLGAYDAYSPASPPPSPEAGTSSISNMFRREYEAAAGSRSYNEVWHTIHRHDHDDYDVDPVVLQPDGECVEGVMNMVKPGSLSRIASSFFEHSETTAKLCLVLHRSVARAMAAYAPLQDLHDELDLEMSLSEAQCERAFRVLAQFDAAEKPFPSERDEFQRLRSSFSKLKTDVQARKRARRRRLSRWQTMVTCRGREGGAAAEWEVERAVGNGTYVAHDLQTIESLVGVVECAVEEDRHAVQLALLQRERHLLQVVLKQLRNTNATLLTQLEDLDVHTCHCVNIINKARSQLLQNIYTTQTMLLKEGRLNQRRIHSHQRIEIGLHNYYYHQFGILITQLVSYM